MSDSQVQRVSRSLLAVVLASPLATASLVACGGALKDPALRADAARRFNCDESRLEAESLGPRTVRVSGCGKSALYSCQQGPSGPLAPIGNPVDQNDAVQSSRPNEGPCTWGVVR